MLAALILGWMLAVMLLSVGVGILLVELLTQAIGPPGSEKAGGVLKIAVAVMVTAIVVVCLLMLGGRAFAHEAPTGWTYPLSCCASYDCRETKAGEVTERQDGFHVPSGEVVPMTDRRVKDSPDGAFHWCAHQAGLDAGKTICLFVPPRSF